MNRAAKLQRTVLLVGALAHPGIVELVRAAKGQRGKEVRLLVGGFHLLLGE